MRDRSSSILVRFSSFWGFSSFPEVALTLFHRLDNGRSRSPDLPPPSEICSGGYRAKEMEEAQASVRARAIALRTRPSAGRALVLLAWVDSLDRIGRPLCSARPQTPHFFPSTVPMSLSLPPSLGLLPCLQPTRTQIPSGELSCGNAERLRDGAPRARVSP